MKIKTLIDSLKLSQIKNQNKKLILRRKKFKNKRN
jgi:hypothetical protein